MKLNRRSKLVHVALVSLMAHGVFAPTFFSSRAVAQNGNDELDRLFEEEEFDEPTGTFNQAPPPPPAPSDFSGAPPVDSGAASGGNDFGAPAGGSSGGGAYGGGSQSLKAKKGAKVNMANAQIEDITNENYPDLIESFDYYC